MSDEQRSEAVAGAAECQGTSEAVHYVCQADEVPPGQRLVRDVAGRSVGIFNVDGRLHALRNRCPHEGGALCLGPVTGTTLPSPERRFDYGLAGQLVRCAWHGWEFEIATGRCLPDPRLRARTYPVVVRDGAVYLEL